VCELPGEPLVNGCPTYVREARESEEIVRLRARDPRAIDQGAAAAHPTRVLLRLLASPNIASKRWVYDQYDSTVRTSTVIGPGGDAGVIRIRGSRHGIAATVDCNGRYVYLDPRIGGMIAVAEAARNLVCVGARPRAVTDNLNFGNPLKPEVYYQMKEAVAGIGAACRAFDTPVVSGNVSLYNESPGGAIYPTPVIGMVGVLEDVERVIGMGFRSTGDAIVLLGSNLDELGGSEYLNVIYGEVAGRPPGVDLKGERDLQETMLELVERKLLRSSHDCAEGGLAVCLAESALADTERWFGVDVTLEDALGAAALLFGESQGRIVATCEPARVDAVIAIAHARGVPARVIGTVGERNGHFRIHCAEATIDAGIEELHEVHSRGILRFMERSPDALEIAVEHATG
jgi:phosphoribosylformylglycinamidine synthase II